MCIESWEITDNAKQKVKKFGVNPERFRLACDLYGVPWGRAELGRTDFPIRNARHGYTFAVALAKAAEDAPRRKVSVASTAGRRAAGAPGQTWTKRA